MKVSITGRHMELTNAIREHAESRLAKTLDEFPRLMSAHMILDVEKYRQIAELVIHAPNHVEVDAKDESSDMYASIDGAVDKAMKQLRKMRDKMVDHKDHVSLGEMEAKIEATQPES
jgi:putative sigma-54 modulation protein